MCYSVDGVQTDTLLRQRTKDWIVFYNLIEFPCLVSVTYTLISCLNFFIPTTKSTQSVNVWSFFFTVLVKCRVEWEQDSRGREDKFSSLVCGQHETQHVSLLIKLGLWNCWDVSASVYSLAVKGIKCRRVDQSRGVTQFCKFKSGHTSAAGSTGALVQLSTATAGKVEGGPNFMSSSGRASQPTPVCVWSLRWSAPASDHLDCPAGGETVVM